MGGCPLILALFPYCLVSLHVPKEKENGGENVKQIGKIVNKLDELIARKEQKIVLVASVDHYLAWLSCFVQLRGVEPSWTRVKFDLQAWVSGPGPGPEVETRDKGGLVRSSL